MRCSASIFLIAAMAVASSAHAGKLQGGSWAPTGCGDEPTAPQLDTVDSHSFQESIQWVKEYETDIKKYDECLIKEAKDDSDAIHDYVEEEQDRVKTAFDGYNAAQKSAQSKFSSEGQGQQGGGRHRGQAPQN